VDVAWWAGEDPRVEEARDLNDAAKLFAVAIAELWMAVLEGIIVWVLHRAGEIAAEQAGRLTASAAFRQAIGEMRNKTSKLGPAFGDWFERNFEQIRKVVADRKVRLKEMEGDAGGPGGADASSSQPSTSSPSTADQTQQQPKKAQSLRDQYLGRTPGKASRTGRQVQTRMRADGTLMDGPEGPIVKGSDGEWYPLEDTDMSHATDAVKWWNDTGRQYGAKSPEVRQWMLNPDNYTLDYYGLNRSAGAQLPDRYLPPLP
jgi:hypothetical protein